ncbi:hypothetical protein AB1Y20_016800 [Prymnesium parvum]|uniref:JmjC domain-containing protein n=1 Tax=Prymnesium parvum TaxID=97485 RepID=A0AB34ICB5_PRYPA
MRPLHHASHAACLALLSAATASPPPPPAALHALHALRLRYAPSTSPHICPPAFPSPHEIPRLPPSPPPSSAPSFASCRLPLLLPRAALADWPALHRWLDDDYLAAALPRLVGAYVAPRDEARAALVAAEGAVEGVAAAAREAAPPLADDPTGEEAPPLDARGFFSAEMSAYFARWMGFDDMAPLRADVNATPFLIDDAVEQGGQEALHAAERRYFRLGSEGGVSSLHFDEYHNVFAQVAGSKRVWLMPPTAWTVALGFPKGHQRYRQSPRRPVFEWAAAERTNASLGLRAVTLEAGDALYIPPFWYHQTLTLRRSAAVNVWSPSAEAMIAARAGELGGGLGGALRAAASKSDAICTAVRLARALAGRVEADGSALLLAVDRAQHAHTRASRRRRAKDSAACPVALDGCVRTPLAADAAAAAALMGEALHMLPDGVRQLSFADLLVDLLDYTSGVQPPWPVERGRQLMLHCLASASSLWASSPESELR